MMMYEGKKLWVSTKEVRWVGSKYQWVIGIYQIAFWKTAEPTKPAYFDFWLKKRHK